jgi:hypothetical protein
MPAGIDSVISHCAIGVVPPGKWDRSRSQWPGPGVSKDAVMTLQFEVVVSS